MNLTVKKEETEIDHASHRPKQIVAWNDAIAKVKKEEPKEKVVPVTTKAELVGNLKSSQKELTTIDKIEKKYGKLKETCKEMLIKKQETDKYIQMIKREPGLHGNSHNNTEHQQRLSRQGSKSNALGAVTS